MSDNSNSRNGPHPGSNNSLGYPKYGYDNTPKRGRQSFDARSMHIDPKLLNSNEATEDARRVSATAHRNWNELHSSVDHNLNPLPGFRHFVETTPNEARLLDKYESVQLMPPVERKRVTVDGEVNNVMLESRIELWASGGAAPFQQMSPQYPLPSQHRSSGMIGRAIIPTQGETEPSSFSAYLDHDNGDNVPHTPYFTGLVYHQVLDAARGDDRIRHSQTLENSEDILEQIENFGQQQIVDWAAPISVPELPDGYGSINNGVDNNVEAFQVSHNHRGYTSPDLAFIEPLEIPRSPSHPQTKSSRTSRTTSVPSEPCPEPGCKRRFRPSVNNQRFCKRHQEKYDRNHAVPPKFTYPGGIESYPKAKGKIYPRYAPLDIAGDRADLRWAEQYEDNAIHQFVAAASTPYEEGSAYHEFHTRQQKVFNGKGFDNENVNVRLRFLYQAIMVVHFGGNAVYPEGGDNDGYGKHPARLPFLERVNKIIEILKLDKRVCMDVIEGRGVTAFVKNPDKYEKRKTQNKDSNERKQKKQALGDRIQAKRKAKGKTAEDSDFDSEEDSDVESDVEVIQPTTLELGAEVCYDTPKSVADDDTVVDIEALPSEYPEQRAGKKRKSESSSTAQAMTTTSRPLKRAKFAIRNDTDGYRENHPFDSTHEVPIAHIGSPSTYLGGDAEEDNNILTATEDVRVVATLESFEDPDLTEGLQSPDHHINFDQLFQRINPDWDEE